MNVQNVNSLNVRLNMISGNLLPMTGDDSSYSIFWKVYSFLVWYFIAAQTCMLIPGYYQMWKEKILKYSLIGIVITMEVIFVVLRIHVRKKLVRRLIQKLNAILSMDDKIMRNIVMDMIKSTEIVFKFYGTISLMSIIIWICLPLKLIFQKNTFFYVDYRKPIWLFSKEPISTSIFMLGTFIVVIHSIYVLTKKISLDSYIINLILLITAQYKYIALKLSMIFHDEIPQVYYNSFIHTQKKLYIETNFTAEMKIKSLCRHHSSTICITLMLKKLLSLNFTLICIINVLRFCAIFIMLLAIPFMTFLESFVIIMYAFGGLTQFYILCSSVQQLLDASTKLTDQAFYQEWYRFKSSIKRTFMLMILANNIRLKLSTFKKYNLSLPSLMMILNQSYSIALLLLRFN